MVDHEIASEVVALWPRLSPRQRNTVTGVIDGFAAMDTPASRRLLLRYLRNATAHPELVGSHLDLRPCGCDNGFRTVNSTGQSTVERCRICSIPVPAYLPPSPYSD